MADFGTDLGKEPMVFNDRGIRRKVTDGANKYTAAPVALDFGIKVKYDPSDEYEPWRYEVTPPTGDGFRSFLNSIDVAISGGIINGGNARFITAEQAEGAAVGYAKHMTRRYKQYLEGQTKTKDYTLTLSLDGTDEKE